MKRIVLSITAVAAGLWLTSASALGLGEIEVRSHLNQRFDAIIPLTSVSAEEATDLRVGVAEQEDFARAGLERADYLSSLHFAVRTDGATPRIEISSDKPEREPFVQMLLEVRSGGNRILRQYTVLLDPPGMKQAAAPAATPAPAKAPTKLTVAPAPAQPVPAATAPVASEPAPVFVEVEHRAPPPDERAVTPRAEPVLTPVPASVVSGSADAGHIAAAPASGELYGPVKPSETLWSIATRVRGNQAVTMDQVLLALYNSNPRAFDGGINGLTRGAMLRIPTADDMRALDAAAAHREVARLRGLPAGKAAAGGTRAQRPVIEPEKIAPPPPASTAEPTQPVATPPPPTVDSGPAPPPAAQSASPAAAHEGGGAAATPAATVAATTTPDTAANPEPAAATPATDAPAEPQAQPVAADQAATNPNSAATSESPADVEATHKPAPAQSPAAASKSPAESGLLDTLLIPLIVGLLVLLAIAWLYTRWRARRAEPPAPAPVPVRKPLAKTAASGAAAAAAASAAAAAGAAALASASKAQAQTQKLSPQEELDRLQASLSEAPHDHIATQQVQSQTQQLDTPAAAQTQAVAADLPPVDFDLTGQFATQTVQIDLDANDPVSEADFHLAYGLYDEAALLLRQAAEKEPARTDIGIKLAETYFAAGKAADFERTAAELKSKVPPAEWQKLAIMGQQLNPESALFKDGAAAASAPVADTALDFNFDVEPSAPAPAPAADSAPALSMRADNGLDFKLDDLELPSLDLDKAHASAAPAASATDAGNTLDFDLGSFDVPTAAPTASLASAPAMTDQPPQSETLDFDLGSFDAPTTSSAAVEKPAATEAAIEEFDFDAVSTDAGDIAGDEASTKLDLARAYVEMGDHEMARGLLDEVLAQGSAQQKQDAQALIQRLA